MKHRSDRSRRWQWETNSQSPGRRGQNLAGWLAGPINLIAKPCYREDPGRGRESTFRRGGSIPGRGGELLQARSFPFRVASEHSQRRLVRPRRQPERANGSNSGRTGPARRRHFRPSDWGVAPSLHLSPPNRGVAPDWRRELTGGTVSGFLAESAGDEPADGTSWPLRTGGWHHSVTLDICRRRTGGWPQLSGGGPNYLFRASRPNLPETNWRDEPAGGTSWPLRTGGWHCFGLEVLGSLAVPAGDEPASGPVLIRTGTPN